MNWAAQVAVIAALAVVGAGGTYFIKGPPNRVVKCDPATLKPDELCLESIPTTADVVWIDARSRAKWEESGVPGSLLWNLDSNEDMQAFEAEVAAHIVNASRVVVYCGDENCGVSRQVADRIRSLDLGPEVFVLHGGWRALHEAGRVRNGAPKK